MHSDKMAFKRWVKSFKVNILFVWLQLYATGSQCDNANAIQVQCYWNTAKAIKVAHLAMKRRIYKIILHSSYCGNGHLHP